MRKPKEPKRRNTNLLKRFDRVNRDFFGGHVCGGIGWRQFPLGRGESITQAQCIFDERLIKVNSVMDDARIPLWYLDFVVYHEMLHLQHGPQQYSADGYGYPHDLRFQCLEVRHPDFDRASKFEAKSLDRIVQSWRRFREWERYSVRKKATHLRLAAKAS